MDIFVILIFENVDVNNVTDNDSLSLLLTKTMPTLLLIFLLTTFEDIIDLKPPTWLP